MCAVLPWLVFVAFAAVSHVTVASNDVIIDSSLILELLDRVNVLETRDRIQQSEIETLRSELAENRKENDELREAVKQQGVELKELHDAFEIQGQQQRSDNDTAVNSQDVSTRDVTSKIVRSVSQPARNRRLLNPETQVAFFASLTTRIPHAGEHQNIVFDKITTNIGDGYNEHQGVFVAPIAGTYAFTSTVLADNDREVWCEMTVNGVGINRIYARGTDTRHDQGTNTMIVSLGAGDDVSVQNLDPDDAIFGSAISYTTFSGFLLWE